MADNDTPTSEVTLEALVARIAEVNERAERAQFEAEALRSENASLGARLARLEGASSQGATAPGSPQSVAAPTATAAAGDQEHVVSRRGAMKALGAAAAGGVGLAVGSALLTASPAAAADSDPLLLGETSNTATGQTALTDTDATDAAIGFYTVLNSASGVALTSAAIYGDSSTGSGIQGASSVDGLSGVGGTDVSSGGGSGVFGQSTNGAGVSGKGTIGILGTCNAPSDIVTGGVIGVGSTYGIGVLASNSAGASMQLYPLGSTTLPANCEPGQFIVLSNGEMYFCAETNIWQRVVLAAPNFNGAGSLGPAGSVNLLSTPIRIFDTRAGQNPQPPLPTTKGAIQPNQVQSVQVTGTAVDGVAVPAGAVAVVCNLTTAEQSGAGFITAYPGGVTAPTTSNVNYVAGVPSANFAVVALSSAGVMDIKCGDASTEVIIDVAGFVF